jgi:hypothetical protein
LELLRIGDEDLSGAVKYSLVELLRNVVQHAASPIGGIACAQFMPASGIVELVVVDCGVGIRATLAPRYAEILDDHRALRFAVQPHVSGTFSRGGYAKMADNAGLGLFFIREIACRSGGGFTLISGKALLDLWGDENGTQHRNYKEAKSGGWPGTVALIRLKRDSIADFEAVLRVCRELAARARDYPADQVLDFADTVPEIEGLRVVPVREFEENVERAAEVRERILTPALDEGELVVLDFSGVAFATQSFVHALLYKILRDRSQQSRAGLTLAACTESTREAVRTVAAYARLGDGQEVAEPTGDS